MTRHSKNNTAKQFFTYYERQQLNYGTQRQILGEDSMRPFQACCLCLQTAVNPVLTPYGCLYCKECIISNLLEQKKELKRQYKKYKEYLKEKEKRDREQHDKEKQKRVAAFSRREDGLNHSQLHSQSSNNPQSSSSSSTEVSGKTLITGPNTNLDNMNNTVTVTDNKAVVKTEGRQTDNFWIPEHTPEVSNDAVSKPSRIPKDPMCNKPLKSNMLIEVEFDVNRGDDGKEDIRFMCPSCIRELTNATGGRVLSGCGHALCSDCYRRFVKDTGQCQQCSARVGEGEAIKVRTSGTGYSGRGHVQTLEAKQYTPTTNFA